MFSKKLNICEIFACLIIVLPLTMVDSGSMQSVWSQQDGSLTYNPTTSKPNIVILDISDLVLENSSKGLISVSGSIQNNSTENVENLKVNVTLFDFEYKTIMDTSRYVSGPFTVYEPNSTDRFSFLMSVDSFDHFKATAFAERVPQ